MYQRQTTSFGLYPTDADAGVWPHRGAGIDLPSARCAVGCWFSNVLNCFVVFLLIIDAAILYTSIKD